MPYGFATLFKIAGAASTTDTAYDWGTGVAVTGNEQHTFAVSKVIITNDDNTDKLLYRVDATKADASRGAFHTLLPGDEATHHVRSTVLWIDASANTPAFRAWGEG